MAMTHKQEHNLGRAFWWVTNFAMATMFLCSAPIAVLAFFAVMLWEIYQGNIEKIKKGLGRSYWDLIAELWDDYYGLILIAFLIDLELYLITLLGAPGLGSFYMVIEIGAGSLGLSLLGVALLVGLAYLVCRQVERLKPVLNKIEYDNKVYLIIDDQVYSPLPLKDEAGNRLIVTATIKGKEVYLFGNRVYLSRLEAEKAPELGAQELLNSEDDSIKITSIGGARNYLTVYDREYALPKANYAAKALRGKQQSAEQQDRVPAESFQPCMGKAYSLQSKAVMIPAVFTQEIMSKDSSMASFFFG